MGIISAVILALGVINISAAPVVSAGTISVSHKITITAVVLPAHYVVIDGQGEIVEITSNTVEDVVPRVFAGSIAEGNERRLSADVYQKYRQLVPQGQGRIGVLYKKVEPAPPSYAQLLFLPFQGSALSLFSRPF